MNVNYITAEIYSILYSLKTFPLEPVELSVRRDRIDFVNTAFL